MRTIVVGDIHGCYAELIELFARVNLSETDCLISVGDIIDRGADSIKVYDLLKHRPNTIVLMGNHERKHLRGTLSYGQEIVKLQFGDRYNEFLTWVKDLPYYYETETAIFVHAAIENGIPISEQKEEVLCGCTAGEKYRTNRYNNTYKWEKIRAICDEFRDSHNPELRDLIAEKERWVKELFDLAPIAIEKVRAKLASLIAIHGVENFKKHANTYSYATLLFNANTGNLTPTLLPQFLRTPAQWLQVMRDLDISIENT
jgi:hypothetical protein